MPQEFETPADALRHFGVKGMKWGVRKDDSGSGRSTERGKVRRAATKASTALDAADSAISKTKMFGLSAERQQKVSNAVKGAALGKAISLRKDPRFRGKDLKKDESLKKEYFDEIANSVKDTFTAELNAARLSEVADYAGSILANVIDISMTPKIQLTGGGLGQIRHDDVSKNPVLLELAFETDNVGHVTEVLTVGGVLKHYGVKGMKWGVTRADKDGSVTVKREKKALRGAKEVTVSQRKAGTRVTSKGGQRHTATNDAIKAEAARRKAKSSTTDSLSNAELKSSIERMNLEQQFNKLAKKNARKNRGERFIDYLIGVDGLATDLDLFLNKA